MDDALELDILRYFEANQEAYPLYKALEQAILTQLSPVERKVSKTQISFSCGKIFAMASLPVRRAKGWPKICILASFGLEHRVDHPRIAVAVEPYPNRWTHHVVIAQPEDVDDALMAWIREAHSFSMTKGRSGSRSGK
ncbi:DUF5655 domain-containing protein [Ruminococcaceae bacterium OttesenSCG-928-L11]|nr:DUF5655 domain-containing protein [Ruminococcaceae bacterium OttesenSCG-928-L11]